MKDGWTEPSNQRTYNSPDVVLSFSLRKTLQPPERAILESVQADLPRWRMLDVGVGAGRTSHHFLPVAGQYVGIDYSPRMIAACQKQFPSRANDFRVCDARALKPFQDGSFDFVLYSYNGLDYMAHEDRLVALGEARRVLCRGGRFCFSSHNLQWIDPRIMSLKSRALFWLLNDRATRDRIGREPHVVLRDLPRTRAYYVTPAEQIAQLEALSFTALRLFSLTGAEIDRGAALVAQDPWLYYLCTVA